MDDKYIDESTLSKVEFETEFELGQQKSYASYVESNYIYLTETDFYPPSDDRVWESNIEDIDGGDNFADYCEYIYEILDEENYFED